MGDIEKATQWKRVAEFQQREDEKNRKLKNEKDKEKSKTTDNKNPYAKNYWDPIWFDLSVDHIGQPFFAWNNKFSEVEKDSENMFVHNQIQGTACDFANYENIFAHLLDTTGKESGRIVVDKKT